MSRPIACVVHGGAWAIPDHLAQESREGVIKAVHAGYDVLQQGGTAIDAVQAAICVLEDVPAFDAGTGSVLNNRGEIEMDAAIMSGVDLSAGAVAGIQDVKNPILVANKVRTDTQHVLLIGRGAGEFAREAGFPVATDLVTDEARREYELRNKYKQSVQTNFDNHQEGAKETVGCDTVGCVALDASGSVAAGTSTGGIAQKSPGRVGDSPILGSGLYADNDSAAASTTGHGESIMKVVLAQRVCAGIGAGKSVADAIEEGLVYMRKRVQGFGGIIIVTPDGQVGHGFTTKRMAWAQATGTAGAAPEVASGLDPASEATLNVYQ